jgi:peptide deformylase
MRYLPDTILRTKAVAIKIRDLKEATVQQLLDDMVESMGFYYGVGIAANQVGTRHRVCIIQRPEDEAPFILINPRITKREGEREVTEGCLSLPGYQASILRSERVWATALDRYGNRVKFDCVTDLLAQALEHETDHLDGTAYIDHLRSPDDLYEIDQTPDGTEEDEQTETHSPGNTITERNQLP